MLLEDLQKAIERLHEVLTTEKTSITRDSAIKRFELCFDLAWKSIKVYAQQEGVECYSPRSCFKSAFQLNLIEYNEEWFKMVEDRNTTAHLYGENLADEVYGRLSIYERLFDGLVRKMQQK